MAAKSDMERLGIFKEVGYHTIGDPYKDPGRSNLIAPTMKGRQLFPGGSKMKSALSHGYFSEFGRVFEKESYSDPIKMRRQQRVKDLSKNVGGKNWIPSNFSKKDCGAGSYFGTFAGKIDYFSAVSRSAPPYKASGKNVLASPSKKGTGYGYVDVALNKYPEYKPHKYNDGSESIKHENEFHKKAIAGRSGPFKSTCYPVDMFDINIYKPIPGQKSGTRSLGDSKKGDFKPFKPSNPAKIDGGCKAGTFDPFPKYSSSPYKVKSYQRPVKVVNSSGKIFVPNTGSKGVPNGSILYSNVQKYVTPANYKHTSSVMAC